MFNQTIYQLDIEKKKIMNYKNWLAMFKLIDTYSKN